MVGKTGYTGGHQGLEAQRPCQQGDRAATKPLPTSHLAPQLLSEASRDRVPQDQRPPRQPRASPSGLGGSPHRVQPSPSEPGQPPLGTSSRLRQQGLLRSRRAGVWMWVLYSPMRPS